MSLLPALQSLAGRASAQTAHLATVEATKNALVLPFFQALGYDVFDPSEFIPEPGPELGFTDSVRPDYLVLRDGVPTLLVECRASGEVLGEVAASHVNWCFEATEARVAVLTNGLQFAFFTDLVHPGHMDERPILVLDLQTLQDSIVNRLAAFTRAAFDLTAIRAGASDISRCFPRLLTQLEAQMDSPSPELVALLMERVYAGPVTHPVRERFTGMVREAFQQILKERIRERLLLALELEGPAETRLKEVERLMTPTPTLLPGVFPQEPEADPPVTVAEATLEAGSDWEPEARPAPRIGWVLGALLVVVALVGALLYGVPKWKRPLPTAQPAGTMVQAGGSPALPPVPAQTPAVPTADLIPGVPVSTPAPAPAAPSAEASLAALVDRGDLVTAAERGLRQAAALPRQQILLRLAIASEGQTVKNILDALPGREADLLLAPIRMKDGRTCYQVFLGNYPTESAAREAAGALPPVFKGPGRTPKLFKSGELPSEQ